VVAGIKGGAKTLSIDHKPDLPEERARIEGLGGRVSFYDVARVEGILAVSRALGDRYLKPYVSAEPYITKGLLGMENDYVVIACDGVWDVLLPSEVIKIAREAVEPQKGAEAIVRAAISSGSTDNITVIVLELKGYVKGFGRDYMEIC
jgi:serine/threonine protein phosphatase PrpC